MELQSSESAVFFDKDGVDREAAPRNPQEICIGADLSKWLLFCGRVLARLQRWPAAVTAIYLAGPFERLTSLQKGQLLYAVLLSNHSIVTRCIYVRLLRRELDRTADDNFWLAAMAQRLDRPRLAAAIYRRTGQQNHTKEELAVARAMAGLTESIVSGSIYKEVSASVDALKLMPGEEVVVVPAGSNYLPLFELWLEQAKRHLRGRILGLALDAGASAKLGSSLNGSVIDLSPYFVFDVDGQIHERARNGLWILRVLVLRELVSRGHRVVSLDLDAVVFSDLQAMLDGFPEADLVAQQDYSIPMEVARKLGFVLCCGFMVLRPTDATKAFLDRYAERTMVELDDQLAINHMLAAAGVTERVTTANYFTFRSNGVIILCPDKSLVSRDIGHGSVVRHFQQHGQTIAELRAQLGLQPADFTGASSDR